LDSARNSARLAKRVRTHADLLQGGIRAARKILDGEDRQVLEQADQRRLVREPAQCLIGVPSFGASTPFWNPPTLRGIAP
jgi:hypothetical protein